MIERLTPFLPWGLAAALLSVVLVAIVRLIAQRFGIFSAPRPRDMHTKPVPRLGGVAIILSFLVVYGVALRGHLDIRFLGLALGALVLLFAGVTDDRRGLSPSRQFLYQSLAALIVICSGIGIDFITNPFGPTGSVIHLDQVRFLLFAYGHFTITVTLWSNLFTYLWLVGMMNVMNWFDGLDGLATGVSAIAAALLAVLSLSVGSPAAVVLMLIVLLGALIGFWPWNWYPAKIFMGTAGSTFLGFILGVAAIISGGKVATALLVLGVPVLDAVWVIARRLFARQSIFVADRRHLHHRLVDAGLSVRQTVLILYGISFAFGALALWKNKTNIKLQLALALLLLVVIIGAGTLAAERIRQKKVQVIKKVDGKTAS